MKEKLAQWSAFVRRSRLHDVVPSFEEVVKVVREFAEPPLRSVAEGTRFGGEWPAAGPWNEGSP